MRRIAVYIGVFGLICAGWLFFGRTPEGLMDKEFKSLKMRWKKSEQAIISTDLLIAEKLRLGSEAQKKSLDSLMAQQNRLRDKKAQLRGELIRIYEEGRPQYESYLSGKQLIFYGGVLLFFLIGGWSMFKSKRKGQKKSEGKKPGGSKARRAGRESPELLVPVEPRVAQRPEGESAPIPPAENPIQSTLSQLAKIAEQTLSPEKGQENIAPNAEPDFGQPVEVTHFSTIKKSDHPPRELPADYGENSVEPGPDTGSEGDVEEIRPPTEPTAEIPATHIKPEPKPEVRPPSAANEGHAPRAPAPPTWENDEKRKKWENYQEQESKKVTVLKLVRRGSTVTEISQRLKISKTEVELMIRDFKSRQ